MLTGGCQETVLIPYTWWAGAVLSYVISSRVPGSLLYLQSLVIFFFAMFAAMVEMETHTAAQDLLFSPPPPF